MQTFSVLLLLFICYHVGERSVLVEERRGQGRRTVISCGLPIKPCAGMSEGGFGFSLFYSVLVVFVVHFVFPLCVNWFGQATIYVPLLHAVLSIIMFC